MAMVDEFGLRPIWDAILEVYQEIAKVCDRHGLRYYVTDGTAIGAVRHSGFIPWDDDFDISMPRPDYERFIELAKTELPSHLKFVNWKNTPELTMMLGKVQDSRREKVEEIEKTTGRILSGGIYVDIFAIDGYPESSAEIVWVKFVTKILACIVRFRCMTFCQQSWKGKLVWILGLIFSVFMPWMTQYRCLRTCENYLMRHPFDSSANTGRASLRITMLNRKPLPRAVWGRAQMHVFDGIRVPLPQDTDAYLRSLYGDYMKMPPEDRRRPTHAYSWRCPWWLGPTRGMK